MDGAVTAMSIHPFCPEGTRQSCRIGFILKADNDQQIALLGVQVPAHGEIAGQPPCVDQLHNISVPPLCDIARPSQRHISSRMVRDEVPNAAAVADARTKKGFVPWRLPVNNQCGRQSTERLG